MTPRPADRPRDQHPQTDADQVGDGVEGVQLAGGRHGVLERLADQRVDDHETDQAASTEEPGDQGGHAEAQEVLHLVQTRHLILARLGGGVEARHLDGEEDQEHQPAHDPLRVATRGVLGAQLPAPARLRRAAALTASATAFVAAWLKTLGMM